MFPLRFPPALAAPPLQHFLSGPLLYPHFPSRVPTIFPTVWQGEGRAYRFWVDG